MLTQGKCQPEDVKCRVTCLHAQYSQWLHERSFRCKEGLFPESCKCCRFCTSQSKVRSVHSPNFIRVSKSIIMAFSSPARRMYSDYLWHHDRRQSWSPSARRVISASDYAGRPGFPQTPPTFRPQPHSSPNWRNREIPEFVPQAFNPQHVVSQAFVQHASSEQARL